MHSQSPRPVSVLGFHEVRRSETGHPSQSPWYHAYGLETAEPADALSMNEAVTIDEPDIFWRSVS